MDIDQGDTNYAGPERRRHKVFVTKHSEYHCRDGVCLAVRDLRTGGFVREHHAIGKRISSGIKFTDDGGVESVSRPEEPNIGDKLCFSSRRADLAHDILTSPLQEIARPPREIVQLYTSN